MHESLRLYDAALAILAEETAALENQNEERLPEMSEQRMLLLEEAWEKRAGCPASFLLERLQTLQKAQSNLTAKAETRREDLREKLKKSRKESVRLTGYGNSLKSGQNITLLCKQG